mmetsp:Transcript_23505/g.55689  ORF Transcript_23505/g.55689 Transcript_23505/m.55689 type:complete len:112 (-) Transcript_23505:17-352(-)
MPSSRRSPPPPTTGSLPRRRCESRRRKKPPTTLLGWLDRGVVALESRRRDAHPKNDAMRCDAEREGIRRRREEEKSGKMLSPPSREKNRRVRSKTIIVGRSSRVLKKKLEF